MGEDYEQNEAGKKRGRVRLNRLGGHKMGELYGRREAEIGRSLKSTRVQESRDRESAGFRKQHKDGGTSERILGY